jgi:predicted ATPase/DNA-binding CsgD family transcriptional regulator
MNRTDSQIKTQSVLHTNIPIVLTSFIGRKHEIVEIRRLLANSRLVTLTGAAGCGKTRLALRLAAEVNHSFADGVYGIELAPLADAARVPRAVARILHVAEQRGRPILEGLIDALEGKHLLLVLDNCEHLLDACRQLVDSLLTATQISIMATTREPLGIAGEMSYPVSPMTLPSHNLPAADMGQFDAIQLFVERARAIVPPFELIPQNARVVASICRHLDGIPLAIELASARLNVLTVEQIAARLDDRFVLLATAPQITHSHHRTLRAAVDWSFDLLSIPEQVMLLRLSVFAGGCSLTTAETVCVGDSVEREQVLDLLSALVNKSLVVANTLQRSEARYTLLETIRQYAHEKLVSASEWTQLRDRHLLYFLQLTEETEPKLRGQYQQLWLDWLAADFDNIRAALSWSVESRNIEAGLRIATAIFQFWVIRDYAEEGFAWLEGLLEHASEGISPLVQAQSLAYASILAGFRGISAIQIEYGHKAAVLAEALGDEGQSALIWARAGEAYAQGRPGPLLPPSRLALAIALAGQAYGARAEGDYETEFRLDKEAIELYREIEDDYYLGLTLITCSFAAMSLRKYDEARAMLDEGLPLLREVGDPYRTAMTLNFSGDLARCESNYADAQIAYEESIELMRELGAVRDLASALHNLGHTCLHLGDVERARARFAESTALHEEQGNVPGIAECLIGYAALAIVGDLFAAGARLLAAAVAIGGERVATTWAATKMEYEHYMALARHYLTEAEFEAEQTAGRALSLEQAIAYAQDVALQVIALAKTSKAPDELTLREREVAVLIAQAKSNDEIAEELVLSKRTVEKHIANIRSKLGFSKRAEIVRWALENQPHK